MPMHPHPRCWAVNINSLERCVDQPGHAGYHFNTVQWDDDACIQHYDNRIKVERLVEVYDLGL